MDNYAFHRDVGEESVEADELRDAPRFTLLLRVAKLICGQGEFVCVIRDISATGTSLRFFHALPKCESYALELHAGLCLEMKNVWDRGREGGFEFLEPIKVEAAINDASNFPKRGVRLQLHIPVTIATLAQSQFGTVQNISQQGARVELNTPLAIDQSVRIAGPGLNEVRSKVRWRHGGEHGLVFDDTFSLGDFATLAAQLQCPILLRG